jgi:hypothetical protein
MNDFYDHLNVLIKENKFISGTISMTIGLILLIYQLNKKEPLNFKNSGVMKWKADINMWGMIIILFLITLFLLF